MAETPIGPGTVLAGRFRLEDLLQESGGAKFWRASDLTLARNVAVHVVGADDPRAERLLAAARTSATVTDGHILRVLDAAQEHGVAYVVNEWGSGMSLDRMLAEGPLSPRRAAWVVKEVADALDTAHRHGVAHGRLVPENVMVSEAGAVKLIGFVVDGVLNGRSHAGAREFGDQSADVANLAALLYAGLVAKWPGTETSSVPPAPQEHGHPLRPRQVRAGIPRPLDAICDRVLNPEQGHRHAVPIETAHEVAAALSDFIGEVSTNGPVEYEHTMVLTPPLRAGDASGATPGGTSDGRSGGTSGGTSDGMSETAADLALIPEEEADPPVTDRPGPDNEPPATDGASAAATPAADSPVETAAETTAEPAAVKSASQDPESTQAGTPVFFDEDSGVGWITAAESRGLGSGEPRRSPPPPPPLPEPEPKPLFAPDPPEGRRRRGWEEPEPESQGPTQRDHAHPGQRYPTAGGLGTGSLPPVWGPDADQDPDDTADWEPHKAGRGWLRLGALIFGCLVLVIAVVFAFNLGRHSDRSATAPPKPSASNHRSSATPGQVLPVKYVRDFDPEASPSEENPQLAPLAIDGDPSTAWHTMTYYGNPKLGGLKDGVGLVLDLGKPEHVSKVSLTLQGQPTSLQILSAGSSGTLPTSLSGLSKVASATGAGPHVDLTLTHPVTTQYLVVWLTSLPPVGGGYEGKVAEVQVHS